MRVHRWVTALVCASALVVGACGGDPAPGPGADDASSGSKAVSVTASNFAFQPVLITVEPGQQVELSFTNDDDTQHSFTSDTLGVDLVLEGKSSGVVSFEAPSSGAAEFHCKFHPSMTGTVATQGAAAGAGDDGSGESEDLDY